MYDYVAICDCGFETFDINLKDLKTEVNRHLFSCCLVRPNPKVIIGRNYKDGDIDDLFKDVIITREDSVNHFNSEVLGGFFGKIKK